MGLLGDITAYIDNLKRRGSNTLADLATNPLGLLSRNLSAFSESLPAAPDSVMPSGSGLLNRPGFQQWGMDVALNAPTMGLLGHTVYHGSPHKFDKFDASKIGTGEGAQAYGYGLYLAERPDTARGYRVSLSNPEYVIGGEVIPSGNVKFSETINSDPEKLAAWMFYNGWNQGKSRREIADAMRANAKYESRPDVWEKAADRVLDFEKPLASVKKHAGGALYTVDLPDEWLPKMLDWDKPLSQQPEAVRKALADNWLAHPDAHANQTGREIYNATATGQRDAASAAAELMKAGIPGIRYLDGGSRKSGEGTYNYVVFPGMEGLLKIISRE